MKGIDRYISELLFDHDCVILPGIGGFLTNYSGARIHPLRHSFQPASRTVVFNANLQTNDGLLIDHVARRQGITYQQASLVVNQYSNEIKVALEEGKTVELAHIGTIRMGREKNIVFMPDESSNFLADSFGLPSFVSPAIKRETVRQRLEKQLTPDPSIPGEAKKPGIGAIANWAAGLAIPITAALVFYMFNPTIVDGPGKDFAGFVPTITLKPNVHEPAGDAGKTADIIRFRELPAQEPKAAAETATEPETIPAKPAKLQKYQIVVGAFSRDSNAEKYVKELQSRNYEAGIVGKSANGLTRVSISGSDSKTDALRMLREVRATENPSAWLLVIR